MVLSRIIRRTDVIYLDFNRVDNDQYKQTVWIMPQGTPDKNFQAGFGELEMIFITLRRI